MTARTRVLSLATVAWCGRWIAKNFRAACLAVALLIGSGVILPPATFAQGTSMAADEGEVDVRLKGYAKTYGSGNGNTIMTWLLFMGLVLVGCVPLFKNAKRE